MGHKHTKEEILAGVLAAAFDDGLSQLTFGRLAKRIGINDRTIVYYFPTKDDLVREVLFGMGLQLQSTLAPALSSPVKSHQELLRLAWPRLARPETDRIFSLYFEAAGLAANGIEPYAGLVPELMKAWIDWAAGFVSGSTTKRRAEAEAAIALLDGLLLLRQLAGPAVANRAARTLGVF